LRRNHAKKRPQGGRCLRPDPQKKEKKKRMEKKNPIEPGERKKFTKRPKKGRSTACLVGPRKKKESKRLEARDRAGGGKKGCGGNEKGPGIKIKSTRPNAKKPQIQRAIQFGGRGEKVV